MLFSFLLLAFYLFIYYYCVLLQAPIMKEYPAKLSLITLQCFFSFIQAVCAAIAMERNLSSWKLGWDFNLLSMAYCVSTIFFSSITFDFFRFQFTISVYYLFILSSSYHIYIVRVTSDDSSLSKLTESRS